MQRRKFLMSTMSGLAGLHAAQHSFATVVIPQKKEKLGVALVGLGYYSTDLLAPALQLTQHCYLAGIVTGTPSKAESWKRLYKIPDRNIYNYGNFSSIADNRDIDIVYVVLPPSMHAEYSVKAANAGKHVWCEKPMALTVAECQGMIDACNRNKVKLSIGYRMQHEPNTRKIIQFIKEMRYGKIISVKAAAGYFDGRTDHWKQSKKMGGGATYDMGVYPLNATRYTTGLEPASVSARSSTTRPHIYKEADETMNFVLEFPGGIVAECETSLGRGLNDLRVTCEKGWYGLAPFQSYSGIRGTTSDGIQLNASIPNQQALQMDDDAQAILDDRPVLVPGEEGLKDIRVVEGIHRSAMSGQKVTLPGL